jgi:hypothetical protein
LRSWPRRVLLLARDPDDPHGETGASRVLAHVKSNLGPLAASLRYEIETEQLTQAGLEMQTAQISETGSSPYTGSELLAPIEPQPAGATAEAIGFLHEELANGPRLVRELAEAAAEAGISFETVRKARKRAGVDRAKQKGVRNGPWVWTLVEPEAGLEREAA